MKKKLSWAAGGLVAIGVAAFFLLSHGKTSDQKYRKAKVDKADVVATVTATGTLSAVTTVSVGSQVSGIIAKLYADFNSQVKKSQLLAELDPTPFLQSVEQRRADLEKAKVELRSAENSLTRAKKLFSEQLLAQSDLDAAQTTRDAAAATVRQSEAALKQALTNMSYAKITSPIDGVVVSRAYDVGQTVAASFQAPTLFMIAQDLTKMQVLTNIDEADVGRIRIAQTASFTVDAFPDAPFRGTVSQIRLSPQIVQNVVTYPVILDVPNPELRLKPGMTANVQVPVDVKRDVLRVPNGALRFRPDPQDISPEAKTPKPQAADAPPAGAPRPPIDATPSAGPPGGGGRPGRGPGGGGMPPGGGRGPGGGGAGGGGGGRPSAPRSGVVYVEVANGKLKPITVKTSITDGNVTAIESSELKAGDEVIVGLATAKAGAPAAGGGGSPGGGGRRPF